MPAGRRPILRNIHLTQNDVAARWHISPRTLERWRWEGIGPPHLKIGGRILYRIVDTDAYEQNALRQETSKDQGVPLMEGEA